MLQIAIKNNETWLICGGREFADQHMFDNVMFQLLGMWGMPSRIVHGAATGADTMADKWGKQHALDVIGLAPDWERHGNAAGPLRNEDMLYRYKPNRVIAFPGGKGTADMVARAKKRGAHQITVIEIKLATAGGAAH